MPPVTDATKVVSLPFRPVGFKVRDGKEATVEEINKWKKENPGSIKQQSYLTIGGIIGAVIGGILGIIGFKKDSKTGEWIGGIFAFAGAIAIAVGKFAGISLGECASEEDEKDPFKKYKDSKILASFTELVENIEKCDEDILAKDKLRQEFLAKYEKSEHLPFLLDVVISNIETHVISKMKTELEFRWEAMSILKQLDDPQISEAFRKILIEKREHPGLQSKILQALVKAKDTKVFDILSTFVVDKDREFGLRWEAIVSLRDNRINNPACIANLTSCLKDTQDRYEFRKECAKTLGELGNIESLQALQEVITEEGLFANDNDSRKCALNAIDQIKARISDSK